LLRSRLGLLLFLLIILVLVLFVIVFVLVLALRLSIVKRFDPPVGGDDDAGDVFELLLIRR